MALPICAICGKKDSKITVHQLPYGSLALCMSATCFDMLCAKTQGSVPVVWVGKEDYIEHELLTEKELKGNERALVEAARAVADHICCDGFWQDWGEGLAESVGEFEKQMIRDTPKDQLPLLIGHLKHGNDEYLANKIKGE
jgi:hypothetical protein